VLAQWAGAVYDGALDAASWIKANIGTLTADGVEASITLLSEWGGNAWGSYGDDFEGWYKAGIGGLSATVNATVNVVTQDASGTEAAKSGNETGKSFAETWRDAFTAGFNSIFGGGGDNGSQDPARGGGGGGIVPGVLKAIYGWEIGFFGGIGTTFASTFATNMQTLFIDPAIEVMHGVFSTLDDALLGDGSLYSDISTAISAVWTAISGWINDAFTDIKTVFGPNSSMDPALGFGTVEDPLGIGDLLKDLIPDSLPDISLPSFDFNMDSVTTAIDGALAWLTSNIPDWMVAFANGDIKGAIRLLFGGSPDNGLVPAPTWSGDPSDAPPPGGFLPPSAPPAGPGGSQPSSPSSNSATLPDGTVVTTLPAVGTGSSLNQVPPPDFTAFNAAIATIPQLLGQQMDAALQLAATVSTGIGTAVGTIFQGMVDNVSVITGVLPTNVGNAFNTTLGVSVAVANGIYVAVSTAFGMMVGNVSGIVNTLPGIVVGAMNAAASSGAAAAYNAGASIGYGMANGIDSAIGAVSAAADRLAAEAQRAAEARAKIASPSKVFHEIGSQMGEGLVLGLASRYGDAAGAGAGLAGAAIPSGSIAGRNGGGDTYNITIIAPESEEYSQYARDAKRGKALAVNLAQLMQNV
jgi:hypothetical protein